MRAVTDASTGRFVRYARWESEVDALRERWRSARPFAHAALDGFFDDAALSALAGEFDAGAEGWIENRHYSQRLRSRGGARLGPAAKAVVAELDSPRARALIEAITGESGLFVDLEMLDGGLSAMGRGDYFDLHTDMRAHARRRRWERRVNLIVYLSEGWRDAWGGALELWTADGSRCAAKVAPRHNRAVLFEVGPGALHGVPEPLACPPGTLRKNLVLYYFREAGREVPITHFRYRARPGEPFRAPLVWANNAALRVYQSARRRLGVTDEGVSRALRWARGERGP